MKKASWKKKIIAECKAVNTYNDAFLPVIETLADVLEQRDHALDCYLNTGASPLIEHTNKAGATNLSKNPLLMLWDDFNKTALSIWRDLGLTPAGLRKLNEKALQGKPDTGMSALAKVLSDFGG